MIAAAEVDTTELPTALISGRSRLARDAAAATTTACGPVRSTTPAGQQRSLYGSKCRRPAGPRSVTPPPTHCRLLVNAVLLMQLFQCFSGVTAAVAGVSKLHISPSGNDVAEVTRPVGAPVVFTCQLVSVIDDVTGGGMRLRRSDVTRQLSNTSRLDWYDKNDVMIPEQHNGPRPMYVERVNSTMTKLYITRTHNKHAGPYTCVHTQQHGHSRVQQSTVTLLLFRDIEFVNVSHVVRAAPGVNVLLPCRVHSEPPPHISWRFGARKIKNDDRYEVLLNGLFITNITSADQGSYHCQALVETSGLFKELKIDLVLYTGPSYIDERQGVILGTRGESLSVWCNASGSAPITYEYFKDGEAIKGDSDSDVIGDPTSGELRFKSLQFSDEGKYLCMASNLVGRVTAERTIKVHLEPKIYVFASVLESRGMTATLQCRSRGRPAPTLAFRRLSSSNNTQDIVYSPQQSTYYDGGRIYVHQVVPGCSELIISHVTVADEGVYECEGRNRLGVDRHLATVSVGYQPHILFGQQPRLLYVWPRQKTRRHRLTCAVDARPSALFTWYHHDNALTRNNETFHMEAVNSTVSVLQISIPVVDNAIEFVDTWIYGRYTCRASNYFGYDLLHVELRKAVVPDAPVNVTAVQILTTSVQLEVQLPQPPTEGLTVTGIEVRNELSVHRFNIDDEVWLTGLRPSTVYLLNVAAVNPVGVGRHIQIPVTTGDLMPPSPVDIISIERSGRRLKSEFIVSWCQPFDGGMTLRRYQLRYRRLTMSSGNESESPSSDWKPAEQWSNLSVSADKLHPLLINYNGSTSQVVLQHVLPALPPHAYYELQVLAMNDLGWSVPPNTAPFYFYTDNDATARSPVDGEDQLNVGQLRGQPSMMTSSASRPPLATAIAVTSLVVMTSVAATVLFDVT